MLYSDKVFFFIVTHIFLQLIFSVTFYRKYNVMGGQINETNRIKKHPHKKDLIKPRAISYHSKLIEGIQLPKIHRIPLFMGPG